MNNLTVFEILPARDADTYIRNKQTSYYVKINPSYAALDSAIFSEESLITFLVEQMTKGEGFTFGDTYGGVPFTPPNKENSQFEVLYIGPVDKNYRDDIIRACQAKSPLPNFKL